MTNNSYKPTRTEAIEKICADYDSLILKPILGEGELKRRLNEGLKKVLEGDSTILENSCFLTQRINLEEEIDYKALYKQVGGRIAKRLSGAGLKTYGDVLKYETSHALRTINGFGPTSLMKLRAYFAQKGIRMS